MGECESKNNIGNREIKVECVFPGIGIHIPDDKLEIISKQKKKSICKIIINKESKGPGFGTGFLCYIGEYKKIKSLVTAYHVLGEEDLKIGNEITITFNDNKKIKSIKIDNSRYIYANEKDDITIIEILDKDKLENYEALDIDTKIYNDYIDFYNEYNNKIIYILHYPEGNISNFSKNNIYHLCSTEVGSSGAPILNLDTFKLIGVHRGYNYFEKELFHEETFIKYKDYFNKENKFKCNLGKIIKESIDNFNKENTIILTLKINENDIDKKIYFLQNYDEMKSKNRSNHRIDINNFVILINDKIYKHKNYFVPRKNIWSISYKNNYNV